ncbi:biogenesis of lysosome-related organelles complex 1, subunit 3 isoform X1 [Rhynchophorus ferrugineus]|uniref:biogenesis of lysosome-related organelles complex 1, subunit 3 isoform X1 n=1 Tax=Rhynchophorus ferrugineus TaxID=354439 RepID=UPI003FCC4C0F
MNNPVVVYGEASETDSEDESKPVIKIEMVNSVQGAVIPGEDSESDNENDASIASAVSALHILNLSTDSNENIDYDTLFQQKLKESNTSLYNNLEHFVQSTINEAGKSLDSIEQHLLKSQITLQGAVSSLKLLSVNSLTLKNKLHSLLSSKFLNNITVTKDENVCSSTGM